LYSKGYYRYRESTLDFKIEARLLFGMLRPQPGSRILEVGCGGGALLSYLEGKGYAATGVDILEEAVNLASNTTNSCEILRAEAGDLPFEDGSFDRLVSQHLIEHLDDFPAVLAEWRRILAEGGVIAMCTPNRSYPCPVLFEDPSHVHIYEPGELRETVSGAGFQVERCMTVFPHLYKGKISIALGVPLYRFFKHVPSFRRRGRSLLLSARKV
jgi:SAM-dependent methyltransferase